MPSSLTDIRARMRADYLPDEAAVVRRLIAEAGLDREARAAISTRAAELVRMVRDNSDPNLMESFLAEYGLSTKEGVALMCLAEALLRVPDAETIEQRHRAYCEIAREVARGEGAHLLDLEVHFAGLPDDVLADLFTPDGIHPTQAGLAALASKLVPQVRALAR